MKQESSIIPIETIERKIYLIRGMKVMLDSDLASLYGIQTKVLVQAVKRNKERFPSDFMFQLSLDELRNWRSQIVTSNPGAKMGLRRPPYVFTEHGVAMLASVLKSKKAIQLNILIVKAFIKLREMLATHKDILIEIEKIKQTQKNHGQHIANILQVITRLMNPPEKTKEPMGFRPKK